MECEDRGFTTILPCPALKLPTDNHYKPLFSLFNGQSFLLGRQPCKLRNIIYQQHGIIDRGTCIMQVQSDQGAVMVVKFSWPAKERTLEDTFLIWAHKCVKDHGDIVNHLPKLKHHQVYNHWVRDHSEYKQHWLQVIVFDKLYPITHLMKVEDLSHAIRGIF